MNKVVVISVACISIFAFRICFSTEFCVGAGFVHLNNLLHDKEEYLNVRVKTRAIIKSDGKEYSLLQSSENSDYSIMTESDSVVIDYRRRHLLPDRDPHDFIRDYLGMVNSKTSNYKLDMTKISRYRQERILCGRIIKRGGSYYFAIDDSIFEKSYFIGD